MTFPNSLPALAKHYQTGQEFPYESLLRLSSILDCSAHPPVHLREMIAKILTHLTIRVGQRPIHSFDAVAIAAVAPYSSLPRSAGIVGRQ